MASNPFDLEPPGGRLGPESKAAAYVILIVCGIMFYGFSIANINYIYVNDFLRLVAQVLLAGYFIVGVFIIHIGWSFFNRKKMFLALVWMIVMWTVAASVLCFLQVLNGHPLAQWIFSMIVVIQLVCLFVVARNRIPLSNQFKFFLTYTSIVLFIIFGTIAVLQLAGYRRRGGVGTDGIFHQILGEDLAGKVAGAYFITYVSAIVIAILIGGIVHIRRKWNFFYELPPDRTIEGYLIYIPPKFGYSKGKWGYLPVGSSDFPDPVAFIEEKNGVRYFKRKVHRAPIEDFSLQKRPGTEKGVFTCRVSNGESKQVKVFYEDGVGKWRLGKWHPYEFEEINEKAE
ncbi:hypothetical protein P4637_20715 [Halalkalibacterium halodurans]|uniref:hypothetical protein n=1 Tax=Halalkalibacterium halodurans TaxID=86665 RepID=UPI002E2425ED|nr:hypothetical protein [Halalkalibacterium halodurans]MED4087236.1 hypothetical protein [Halalkalibacterium halodurans]MED4106946.1 hypothetical protein [Halalkalibacterium halodurans]MED4111016.1 hypothetical protein [Halalkalibacterium halodurans]MED4125641.1 hypothetical protein [Halalkalibacterium halodurans]